MPSLDGGGMEKMMINLSKSLLRLGVEVNFVLMNKKGDYDGSIKEEVKVVNFDVKNMVSSVPYLAEYIKNKRPEKIMSVGRASNITLLLASKIAKHNLEKVISLRNIVNEGRNKWKDLIYKYLIKITYGGADKYIPISYGVYEDHKSIVDISKDKTNVIYNPVFSKKIVSKSKKKVKHKWFNGEEKIILSAGRLCRQKNFELLVKSFSKVCKDIESKLVILGKGEKRKDIIRTASKKNVRDKVDLIGFVSNPYKYMAKADLFVLPSRWEGFGNVIVEAMAVGTSIVATNCPGGPAEILEKGKWGDLVPTNSPKAMANAIVDNLRNPQNEDDLVRRAKNFCIDKIAPEYEQFLFRG
jgi:glycosyltransferase involved in cell wall biosynthesis